MNSLREEIQAICKEIEELKRRVDALESG